MIHLINNNYSQSTEGIQMLCTRFFFFPESKFPEDPKRKERFTNDLETKIDFI